MFNWTVKIEVIVLTLIFLGTPTFARTQDRQLVDGVPEHNGVPERPDAPGFRYNAGKPVGERTSKPSRAGYQFTESAIDSKPVLENIRSRMKSSDGSAGAFESFFSGLFEFGTVITTLSLNSFQNGTRIDTNLTNSHE